MSETRLIDANALYREVKTECNPYGKPTIGFDDGKKVLELIDVAPTIEAEPVRHGRWINHHTDYGSKWNCSVCVLPTIRVGIGISFEIERFAFCPFCGARMDATDTNDGGKGDDNSD